MKAQLLNENETRERLGGIGRTKLYEITSNGSLRSVKIGRRRFWPEDAVVDFVANLEAGDAA